MNSNPEILLRRATDWTDQTYYERLLECTKALYTHGYIARVDYDRIENRLWQGLCRARETERERGNHA